MPKRNKVAVFATEPVTGRIGGLGIRQLEVARELSRHCEVRLLTPFQVQEHQESFPVQRIVYEQPSTFRDHIRWADAVYSISLSVLPEARKFNKPVAADLLVPEYFENLEGMPLDLFHAQEKCERFGRTLSRTARLLAAADFFLAPTERSRDFYLGQLVLLGRLRPDDYPHDPLFRSLIEVAPFGIPRIAPRNGKTLFRDKLPGLGPADFILLWGGSMANWFDAMTPLKAMARLKRRRPEVKLIFTGNKHPVWGKLPPAHREVLDFAKEKGLLNKNVFLHSDWVPYEDHQYYLTEADAGISSFHNHIENQFSFRIRVLDYLWGNLPILTNPGNTQSDLVQKENLGAVLPFADDRALADRLALWSRDPETRRRIQENIRRVKSRFHWDRVLAPLVRFCQNPRRTAGLFADKGVPQDRPQTSATFIFDPNRFVESVPHHPCMRLTQARRALDAGEREAAIQNLREYMDLWGSGLESALFKNPFFDLTAEFHTGELLELLPDHPHALLLQAKQALDADDLDLAQALVEKETALFGDTLEGTFLQGLICQRRGWHAQAIPEFETVVAALPGHLAFLLPLADSLVENGAGPRARQLYTRAWRESFQGPHSAEEWIRTRAALAIARMDLALRPELATLQRYFQRDRTNESLASIIASQMELEGQALMRRGDGDRARRFFKKAWRRNGRTSGESWIRVVAALNLSRLERDRRPEIDTLTHCLQRDPENERLAYALASTLEKQGRRRDARDMFEQFTGQFQDPVILGSVWYRLALLSPKSKQKGMVRKCLTLVPTHRAARQLLRSL